MSIDNSRPLTLRTAERCIEVLGLHDYRWVQFDGMPVTDNLSERPMQSMIRRRIELSHDEVMEIIAENMLADPKLSGRYLRAYGPSVTVPLRGVLYDIATNIIAAAAYDLLIEQPKNGRQMACQEV